MKKIFQQLVIISLLILFSVLAYAFTPVVAQTEVDVWGDTITGQNFGAEQLQEVGLGKDDPRVIVINIIRIVLGLLGVIAVGLLMYGGWIWMTAQGNPENVDKAKLIIRNAVIGLLIILSVFAIATYVLSRLTFATGATSASYCVSGETEQCKPGDCWRACNSGVWGSCVGADCGTLGTNVDIACDGNTLLPGCQEDDSICATYNKYCDAGSCTCKSKSGYGEACGAGQDKAECSKNSDKCSTYLSCDYDATDDRCECTGPPVIEEITPVGGFCDGDPNVYCLTSADCRNNATCNQGTPNGMAGNLVTINGKNFLTYDSATSKVLFWGGSGYSVEASLASTVNPACVNSWTDTQIIVVVPNGAQTGAIKVEAINGADLSNTTPGGNIPDFVLNAIDRPGLCQIDPVSGPTDALIVYNGVKLTGVTAYYGNILKNVKANTSSFSSNVQGEATVPNITPGRTSTFAQAGSQPNSNYLNFVKEPEAPSAPMIVSISPTTGPEGQYVTIAGSGFGAVRSGSTVYFGKTEADFSFPKACANSVWSDSQIIVKVPSGLGDDELYDVSVDKGKDKVISPIQFKYDKDLVLTPGLCLIYPMFGQHNQEINLWGEYFGKVDANSKVRFYLGQDQSGTNITYWDVDKSVLGARPDKVVTTIHQQSATGPVNIVKWDSKNSVELVSNDVYLTIGQCQSDSDCGAGVCCPNGTPEVGRCQSTPDLCFGSTDSSVYEWEFSTSNKAECPANKPAQCEDNSCCSTIKNCQDTSGTGVTTCTDDNSCSGYGINMCYDSIYCPNSPGSCSPNPKVTTYGGSCDCGILGYLNSNFNNALNRCVSNVQTCSLASTAPDVNGIAVPTYCAVYNGAPRWHLTTDQTCPANFPTKTSGGDCVDSTSSCELCTSGLICQNDNGRGVCASKYPVCANNYQCINKVCTRDSGSCDCCCDKTQNNPDQTNTACCAPLTCGNTCGSSATDPTDSDDQWGSCSGCSNVGTTQAENDAACNCTGTNGKYCDGSVPGGVCRDCSQIGDASECSKHGSCCVDFQSGNACTGVELPDQDGDGNPEQRSTIVEAGFKYCGYYQCTDNCQAPQKEGVYNNLTTCTDDCPVTCDGDVTTATCDQDASLCPTDKPICNDKCLCEADARPVGSSCYDAYGSCSERCIVGYTCLDVNGSSGVGCIPAGSADSCKCCCDPKLPPDQDLCKDINPDLTCEPNINECTGQNRGACCGCTSDEQCGDPEKVGCGQSTCCSARPAVEIVYPDPTQTTACRNTLISATFDQKMNVGSLTGNMIVAGDYGTSLCPASTDLLTDLAFNDGSGNWLERAWQKIKQWLANMLGDSATAAGNFCVVKGRTTNQTIIVGGKEKTVAEFIVDTPLDPNIKYYVIIKGDKALNSSSGVLSANGVGMNGNNWDVTVPPLSIFNGITYPRAQIWSFTTGPDICQINTVEVVPSQHLFQRPYIDYVFEARAQASNGQYIQRIPGVYNWQWDWSVENVDVATVKYDRATDNFATVTSGNKEDAQTWLYAEAVIIDDIISPLSTKGRAVTGKARITLFLCANPWPAVSDPNIWPIRWTDRNDNCDICVDQVTGAQKPCVPDSDCINNDFSLYYCRDKSTDATIDDLPSLALDPAIRGKYTYQGSKGLIEVLKDFLFSREDRPVAPTVADWSVVNDATAVKGGQAVINWTVAKGFIYKLYYGKTKGKYDTSVVVTGPPFTVTGLKNGQTYYFVMTSINDKRVESEFSDEKSLTVKDVVAPAVPTNFSAVVQATDAQGQPSVPKIVAEWTLATDDVLKYLIEYGPYQSPAIQANAGLHYTYTVNDLDNLSVQDYYIRVMAVDVAGNQSQPAQLFCTKGCSGQCDCT